MSRVTKEDRQRLHEILDFVIDFKLNNEKNSAKPHWATLNTHTLSKMNLIEAHELELAVFNFNEDDIISECCDSIAVPLFAIDNIRRGIK